MPNLVTLFKRPQVRSAQNKMDRFDVLNSVPRFGEISPLWHFFHLVFENILSLLWQIILLCSVGNAKILNKSSSNLVTLVVTLKANLFFPQINSHSFLVISLGTFRLLSLFLSPSSSYFQSEQIG